MAEINKNKKSDAWRTWMSWGKSAVELLQRRGEITETPTAETNAKIEAMITARAHAAAFDKPKIQLRYSYSIDLFLGKAGGPKRDAFEAALPPYIEITRLFIPFTDGSVILINSPSEDTVNCGKYVSLFAKNKEMAKIMKVDDERISALSEIIQLTRNPNGGGALSSEDIENYLVRDMNLSKVGNLVTVKINMSPQAVSITKAGSVLREFFNHPTDTVAYSVEQYLANEFHLKG